jgi:hypothetical protein
MPHGITRVLTNIHLPPAEGYSLRTFGDYLPGGPDPAWRPEKERRDLADILALIPASEKPDVLILASPEYLPIPVDIAAFPGTRILLITDWNVCLRFLPDLCPLFDFCFTDWPGYRLMRKAGVANVHHQPLFGHDPAAFAFQGKPRNLEVSFCGNLNPGMHRERNRLLARLARWGSARPIHLGQAFNEAYVDVLNRSRLVFNYSIRGEANMRLFEAMACGAVPLVEASNQEVGILFQEGQHFFRYEPDRLEATLDALLADPARIEAAALRARTAVARHTKSEQIRALLDHAAREGAAQVTMAAGPAKPGNPATPIHPAGHPATLDPLTSLRAKKALIKLRVLGAAYTMPEALAELQARAATAPGLDDETLPACLLSLIENNPGESLAAANKVLDLMLDRVKVPAAVRALFRMRLHALHGSWQEVLDASQKSLEALDALAAAPMGPESLRDFYGQFHPPIALGKGVNSDLNRAYRRDFTEASLQGYLDLMRSHCLAAQALALLALGRPREALDLADRIPTDRFASLEPYALLMEACGRVGDNVRLREVLRAWFRDKPLDTSVWTQVTEELARLGDKQELTAVLEEMLTYARFFLPANQADRLREMLEKQRA